MIKANNPLRRALVIIDMQKGMSGPAAGERNNPGAEQAIASLLAAWRTAGAPIVHVRHISRMPGSPFLPGQEGVEFQAELAPLGSEHTVEKHVADAFVNSSLERWLHVRAIDSVVVVGVSTNNSVEATARTAGNLGFETIVVADACFAFAKTDYDGVPRTAAEVHAMSLANLQGEYASVVSSVELLGALQASSRDDYREAYATDSPPASLAPVLARNASKHKENTVIRTATAGDADSVARIYNHYVLNTSVTFEEEAVATQEMAGRIAEVGSASLPWLVAEVSGEIVGFAYASKWKGRCAYRFSVESTVYLDSNAVGKGHGTALYERLFELLRERGMHVVIAGIALPNPASVALHERFGLKKVAQFSEVGFKFGKWIDVGYWQTKLPSQSTAGA